MANIEPTQRINASIGATALPQLENHTGLTVSSEVANCGDGVATIQLPRFILSWSNYLVLMRIQRKLKKWREELKE